MKYSTVVYQILEKALLKLQMRLPFPIIFIMTNLIKFSWPKLKDIIDP